jgi:hypothetical protein
MALVASACLVRVAGNQVLTATYAMRVSSVPTVRYGCSILNNYLFKYDDDVRSPGPQKTSESCDLICTNLSLGITAVAAELL